MTEKLSLKWGGVKGWNNLTDKSVEIIKRYFADGISMSCALDKPTEDRKRILIELIDQLDGTIHQEAKKIHYGIWKGTRQMKLATILMAIGAIAFIISVATAQQFRAVDGDTFRIVATGERIRLNNIDAPEIHPCRCELECVLGQAATVMLQRILDRGDIIISRIKQDKYGRTVAAVASSGADVGDMLWEAGLARPYQGGQRKPWCP